MRPLGHMVLPTVPTTVAEDHADLSRNAGNTQPMDARRVIAVEAGPIGAGGDTFNRRRVHSQKSSPS